MRVVLEQDHLAMCMELLGDMPLGMTTAGKHAKKLFDKVRSANPQTIGSFHNAMGLLVSRFLDMHARALQVNL